MEMQNGAMMMTSILMRNSMMPLEELSERKMKRSRVVQIYHKLKILIYLFRLAKVQTLYKLL